MVYPSFLNWKAFKRRAGPVHTNAVPKRKGFRCHRKRIDRFASTLPFWCVFDCPDLNVRIGRSDERWTLCACYKHTSVVVFILMRFRPFTIIRYVCVFVLIPFQERFQIDEMKTLSVLVWVEGLKHRKSAFSNAVTMISADEVRTGPQL